MLHENSGQNYLLYNNTNKQWCTKDNTKKNGLFSKNNTSDKKKKNQILKRKIHFCESLSFLKMSVPN